MTLTCDPSEETKGGSSRSLVAERDSGVGEPGTALHPEARGVGSSGATSSQEQDAKETCRAELSDVERAKICCDRAETYLAKTTQR